MNYLIKQPEKENIILCLNWKQQVNKCKLMMSHCCHQRPVLEHKAHHLFQAANQLTATSPVAKAGGSFFTHTV